MMMRVAMVPVIAMMVRLSGRNRQRAQTHDCCKNCFHILTGYSRGAWEPDLSASARGSACFGVLGKLEVEILPRLGSATEVESWA
jgi:hypothetical protein